MNTIAASHIEVLDLFSAAAWEKGQA